MMKDIARGAAWMVAFRFAERGLGLISLLILARLLVPEDFGIIAMAMSVIAMIELVGSFGFDVALIQHKDPQRSHFDTVFTLNVLFGLGGGAMLTLLAYPTAAYFNEPRLVPVMYVLAGAWALQGFENVGTVLFRRNMEFDREFRFMTGKRLLGFFVTLIAAYALRNYWALVIGIVIGRASAVALSYAVHPYRPRISLTALRELMSFSSWMFLGNVFGFLNQRLSTFVIGRYTGSRELGQYTLAYEIATLPASELLAPINRAVIPGFARIAGDSAALRSGFLEVMGATTLFAVPAAFGIAVVAEPLVRVVLTDKWIDAVGILQVLAFLGTVAAIISSTTPAYYALGRPRIAVYLSATRFFIVLPAMIIATSQFGIIGAAWADLGAALLILPVSLAVACRELAIPPGAMLRRIWRPLVASLAMYYLVRLLLETMQNQPAGLAPVSRLAIAVIAGIIFYGVTLFLLWLASGREQGIEGRLLAALRDRRR